MHIIGNEQPLKKKHSLSLVLMVFYFFKKAPLLLQSLSYWDYRIQVLFLLGGKAKEIEINGSLSVLND